MELEQPTSAFEHAGGPRVRQNSARGCRSPEQMLASLQERLSWLKPGASGGPRYVSLESYTVRCGQCLRQPCSHGPYVKLVIGRHKRGKRTRIHIPREIVGPVAEAVCRRQRITAGNRRAIAMLWGHYWQVRLYTPWRWLPAKDWWPTSRLAKMGAAARDRRDQV